MRAERAVADREIGEVIDTNLGFLGCLSKKHVILDGGFKYFAFSPLFGEIIQFDEHIFSDGLKPPTSQSWISRMFIT